MASDYYIDIVPADYEEGGKYWAPPMFQTSDYGGVIPVAVSRRDPEVPDDTLSGFFSAITKPFKGAVKAVGKVGGDMIHTANNAVKAVTKPISGIPVVGHVLVSAVKLNPISLQAELVKNVASGERIDMAVINAARGQIAAFRDVAPYVQFILSFIPGVGTGVSAAMAAGVALAEGRTITDAVLNAAASALPGGALAKDAFTGVSAIVHGDTIDAAALKMFKSKLGPQAYDALEAARKIARGKDAKKVILQAVRKQLNPAQQKALDIATALGTARNLQSKVVGALGKPAVLNAIAKTAGAALKAPKLANVYKTLPADAKKGAEIAAGLIASKGITAQGMVAARAAMKPRERVGFDALAKAAVNAANPEHQTLVSRGMALRGNWVPANPRDKAAVTGRLIRGKTTVKGTFKRVS